MRRILWRHRCAELYRAFINDPSESGLSLEDSHYLRHERLEERIVLSAPTIDPVTSDTDVTYSDGMNTLTTDIENLPLTQTGLSIELTGIDNGLTGDDTLTITAASSNETIVTVTSPVAHIPGETTATLSFDTLNVRGTATITITLDNGMDPAVMLTFDVTVPLAVDDSISLMENASPVSGNLLNNDNLLESEFAVTSIGAASAGTLTLVDAETGDFTFDPGTDFDDLAEGEMTTVTVNYEVTEWNNPARTIGDITGSETGTLTITITGQNDAPSIDLDADNSSGATGNDYQGTYGAGSTAVAAVDSDLVITDVDNTTLQSVTITLTNPQDGTDESLGITLPGMLPVGVMADTSDPHVISITGPMTISDLETWIGTLTYVNSNTSATEGARTIEVVVNDGMANSLLATSTINVVRQAELAVAISGPNAVLEQGKVIYTITLTNNGPSDASNITVNVPVPTDTTYDSGNTVIPGGTTYDETDWVITSLEASASVSLTLAVDVDMGVVLGAGNELSLTATITAFDESAAEVNNPDDNTATLETNVVGFQTDVSVSITDSPDPVAPGATVTYMVTFTNEGIDEINSLQVMLGIDSDLNNVMYSAGAGSFNSGSGNWTGLTLASGEMVTLTITGDVAPGVVIDPNNPELSLTATLTEVNGDSTPDDDSSNDAATETTEVLLQTDVSVSVTDSPDPAAPTGTVTYLVTFTNNGIDEVTSLQVNLSIDADLNNVMYSEGAGTFNSGTGDWTGLTLATGETVTLTVTGEVNSGVTIDPLNPELSFTATLTEVNGDSTPDDDSSNDSATETTEVQLQTDVSVSIADSPDPVTPGGTVTYQVTFTNNGIDEVTSLQVNLSIDSDLNNVMYSAGEGSFNSGTGDLTGLSLITGESVILTITGDVDSGVVIDPVNPELSLTATLTEVNGDSTPDDNSSNDAATETTEVRLQKDLAVSVTDSPDPVVISGTVTYVVTFKNEGIDEITSLQVNLSVDSDLNNVMYSASTGTFNSGTGDLTGLTLATGETVTLTVTGDVVPGVVIDPDNPELSFTATLTEVNGDSTPDGDSSNNTATETTEVRRLQDVSVEITELTPDPNAPGGTVTYVVTLTNQGITNVTSLRVGLTVPGDITSVTYSVMHDGMSGAFNSSNGNLTLPVGHVLVSGDFVTLTVSGTLKTPLDPKQLTFKADLERVNGSTTFDQFDGNDHATETTDVSYQDNLAVSVITSPDPSIAGTNQTYTITVENQGRTAATGVIVSIPLPAGVTFVSEDSGGNYDPMTGIWMVGDLGIVNSGSDTATLILVVAVDADYSSNTLVLDPTITMRDGVALSDDNADDDHFEISTDVERNVDVQVSMTGPSDANAGETVAYSIDVTNNGPSQATGVVVVVDVDDPSKIELLSVSGSPSNAQVSFTISDVDAPTAERSITFTITTLDPGETVILTYQAKVNPDASEGGQFTVNAEFTTLTPLPGQTQTDNSSADDTDSVTTTIHRLVDLELSLTGPSTVIAGQPFDYVLQVDNLGPSNATNVVIKFSPATITNNINGWVTISGPVVSTGAISAEMIDDGLGGMIPTGNLLWTIGSLDVTDTPLTLTYSFTTNVMIKGIDNIFTDFAAIVLSGQEDTFVDGVSFSTANDLVLGHTVVLNDSPVAQDGNGAGDEGNPADDPRTIVVDLLALADDDQASAVPAIVGGGLSFIKLSNGTAILTDAGGIDHDASGYLQGSVSIVGSNLVYGYSANIDGLREGETLTQVITYQAVDPAGQTSPARTITIQITGANDVPVIQTLSAPSADETVVVTLSGTFTDLDRALGQGEDIHVLSVTPPGGYPFEIVPNTTLITFDGNTGLYSFSVDVIFQDDNPTNSLSDLVTLTFEVDDQIITATGELSVTVNDLTPSVSTSVSNPQLDTLGRLSLPIKISDPSALDTIKIEVRRVVDVPDDEGKSTNWEVYDNTDSSMIVLDPETGIATLTLELEYNANEVPSDLQFNVQVRVTDDDGGVSPAAASIDIAVTVPPGIGIPPITTELDEPAALSPVSFSAQPVPQSTNTISAPENVQRPIVAVAEKETVELELRIVWNFGDEAPWEEKITKRIANNRAELQEKLKELSDLLQGLPDNEYRAYLIRGDGTENLLMNVRIRDGQIIDLNEQQGASDAAGRAEAANDQNSPEQVPGEPMSGLDFRGLFIPSNSAENSLLERSGTDPFARFGRGIPVDAWQSVYRARAASIVDN